MPSNSYHTLLHCHAEPIERALDQGSPSDPPALDPVPPLHHPRLLDGPQYYLHSKEVDSAALGVHGLAIR